MPVPRLFEAPNRPDEQWAHVLATLLGLAGPDTRSALVEELTGEALPDTDAMLVREQRPLREDPDRIVVDLVARGAGWTLALDASLAFDAVDAGRIAEVYDALDEVADRTILIAVTPDRRPPAALDAAIADGRDIRHRSWLRVRDWVQERPERGAAEGVDLALLREAEYFLTPRVAELYRLEGIMPLIPESARPALATAFYDLNDLAPAPLVQSSAADDTRIVFPRTGDPVAELAAAGNALTLRIAADSAGPGMSTEGQWQELSIAEETDYEAARGWVQRVARDLLPARR